MDNKNEKNINIDINKIIFELKSELIQLQIETKEFKVSHQGFDSGLLNLLSSIEKNFTDNPDPKHLRKQALGIFRLVTDNLALEKSDLGKKIMAFRLKIKRLIYLLESN